jgi:hypothetical protein
MFDGGAAHAHVLIAAGQLHQHAVMLRIVGQFGHGRSTDRGVRMLPPGLRLETIEERHLGSALQLRRVGGDAATTHPAQLVNRSILG